MITVEEHDDEMRRPLGLTLLAGLYLFFFLLSASTFGYPFPFLGHILTGTVAKTLVLTDSLVCLYLFLGVFKRQVLTWYLLIVYNLFQVVNTQCLPDIRIVTGIEVVGQLGFQVPPVHYNQDGRVLHRLHPRHHQQSHSRVLGFLRLPFFNCFRVGSNFLLEPIHKLRVSASWCRWVWVMWSAHEVKLADHRPSRIHGGGK